MADWYQLGQRLDAVVKVSCGRSGGACGEQVDVEVAEPYAARLAECGGGDGVKHVVGEVGGVGGVAACGFGPGQDECGSGPAGPADAGVRDRGRRVGTRLGVVAEHEVGLGEVKL